MPNVNVVTVGGHLGRDAEQKFFAGGKSVVEFSVAVSGWKGKDGTAPTYWIDCKAFGKTGEGVVGQLVKGAGVVVTGRLQTESWVGKAGEKRSKVVVACEAIGIVPKQPLPESQRADYDDAGVVDQGPVDGDIPF